MFKNDSLESKSLLIEIFYPVDWLEFVMKALFSVLQDYEKAAFESDEGAPLRYCENLLLIAFSSSAFSKTAKDRHGKNELIVQSALAESERVPADI